jgi:Domain of unknown function (DUF4126)
VSILLLAFLIGVVAGLRALTPLAVVSWAACLSRLPVEGTRLAFLGFAVTPYIFTVLAIAELVADKLPQTPSRKAAMPFRVRIVSGALCGAALGAASPEVMNNASQVSSCGLRVAPPRTRIVAGATVAARSGGRTGLVIGRSLHSEPAPIPGNKKPRSRAGQGSFQNSRPFSALFNVGRKPAGSNHHDRSFPTPPEHSRQGSLKKFRPIARASHHHSADHNATNIR